MSSRKQRERSPRKAPPAKKSNDRVSKRPARGYHTFRNGMLNVAPKGHEKEMVQSNQQSPLLRLPAEIRNTIWKYVLGGKTIRQGGYAYSNYKLFPEPGDRINIFALLRTCRQIYAEGALFPIAGNTFSVTSFEDFGKVIRKFRTHQLSQIKELQIEISIDEVEFSSSNFYYFQRHFNTAKLKRLPNLRHLNICLFPIRNNKSMMASADYERMLRSLLQSVPIGEGYKVVVQRMEMTWSQFVEAWSGTLQSSDVKDGDDEDSDEEASDDGDSYAEDGGYDI